MTRTERASMTRHRTRAEERAAEIDVSPTTLLAEIERLKGELETSEQAAAEHLASLQRERADFANFKRRTADEREQTLGLASESLLRKVLALADDFDRAIDAMPEPLHGDSWVEGIAAIDRKLRMLLDSEGVTAIEALGRQFDPREHEAIATIPGTGRPAGEVVAEALRGYRIRDRVLRPSLVAVAEEAAPADTGGDPDRQN